MPSTPYAEPAFIAQTPAPGPFWYSNLQLAIPMRWSNTATFGAPMQPVRKDTYDQLMQRTSGDAYAGTAPTRAIFTGVDEPCQ